MKQGAGFTLIELLIVLAIIAILLSIGYVSLSRYQQTVTIRQAAFNLSTSLGNLRSVARRTGHFETLSATSGSSTFQTIDTVGTSSTSATTALPTGVTFASTKSVVFAAPHGLAQNTVGVTGFTPVNFGLNGPGGRTISVNVIGIGGKVVVIGY